MVNAALVDGSLYSLLINNVKITNFDCCLKKDVGDVDYKGTYTFNNTLVGAFSDELPCYYGNIYINNQSVARPCVVDMAAGASWGFFNLSFCGTRNDITQKLLNLKNNLNGSNVWDISKNASAIFAGKTANNTYDIELLTDIITHVVKFNTSDKEVATNILQCVDSILRSDKDLVIKAENRTGSSSKILDNLDKLAMSQKIKEKGKLQTITTSKLALGIFQPRVALPLTIYSPIRMSNHTEIMLLPQGTNVKSISSSEVTITLPLEVILQTGNEKIYFYIFQSNVLFLSGQHNAQPTFSGIESFVQSPVISASVGHKRITNLKNLIEMKFTVHLIPNKTGTSFCKFWNSTLTGTSLGGHTGGWSTEGCQTVISANNNAVTCRCNHLTNFAVILDVGQPLHRPLTLKFMSYIGCGIAMAGVLLTIISRLVPKNLRQKVSATILVNICTPLLLTLVVFSAGVNRRKPEIGCRIVALLIHYFTLATFFWMGIEVFNLYRTFIKVLTECSRRFLVCCYLTGWGVPLVITIVTAATQWKMMGPSTPAHPQFCVLHGIAFYITLVLPACVILLANMVVLAVILRRIGLHAIVTNDTKKEREESMAHVRTAFACTVLLGLTWLFAIFAVDDLRDVFQWLFCIFNSLLGLFMFLFYTLSNREVRREWKVCCGWKETKSATNSPTHTERKQISNDGRNTAVTDIPLRECPYAT